MSSSGTTIDLPWLREVQMNQLVFTNELCVGCNRCISACSCPGANMARNEDGNNVTQQLIPQSAINTVNKLYRSAFSVFFRSMEFKDGIQLVP